MNFKELAAVSGKSSLFKVASPIRIGVILESLDSEKKKMVASTRHKISLLSEISIYTTDKKGAVPLEMVMKKIHKAFNGVINLDKKSDSEKLKSFLKSILPQYDEARVYVSDIKKLVNWYAQLVAQAPEVLKEQADFPEESSKNSKTADAGSQI